MGKQGEEYLLVKYDVSGIQDYIFATNRLLENAGASVQVTNLLRRELPEAMRGAAGALGMTVACDWERKKQGETVSRVISETGDGRAAGRGAGQGSGLRMLEEPAIAAEILYIGGGNALVLFREEELFRETNERLGEKAARDYQGLTLGATFLRTGLLDFDRDRRELDEKLQQNKSSMRRLPLFTPFSVVEQETESALPVVLENEGAEKGLEIRAGERLTVRQRQKRAAYQEAWDDGNGAPNPQIVRKPFPEDERYPYPREMDALCRKEEEDSYIAVVHIDGNGMGAAVQRCMREKEYGRAVPAIREKSQQIAELFTETYRHLYSDFVVWFDREEGQIPAGQERKVLPLRPMLMDGDDFTFLCRAEFALPLAAGFIERLQRKQSGELAAVEERITACAGISFVNSHFPFFAAYEIAEESCANAKKKWYETADSTKNYIDFQMIQGSELDLEETKAYRKWQKRPYEKGDLKGVCGVLSRMQEWPSGRLHRLYRAFLEGNGALERLEKEYESRGYRLQELGGENWQNGALFDALELRGLCHLGMMEAMLEQRED